MKTIYIILIAIVLTSCSDKVLFTLSVRNDLISKGVDLTKIQFYNDRLFTLERDLSNSKISITSGKVKQLNGKRINVIAFSQFTPGILISESNNRNEVAFESGEGRNLSFSLNTRDGTYQLSAFNNEVIPYLGELYQITSKYDVKLMISKSSLNSIKYERTRAKGIKVN